MDESQVPTLQEFREKFRRPNYLNDPRTPVQDTLDWLQMIEDRYYELYGQEKIESLRPRKSSKEAE